MMSVAVIKLTLFICIVTVKPLPLVSTCPNGFKSRGGGTTCCRTKICSPGEGYKLCNGTSENPLEDVCFKCPSGTHNKDPINTAEMPAVLPVCSPIDCSCNHDGTVIENKEACEMGERKICVCDRRNLFYGRDPMVCERVEDPNFIVRIQQPGSELTLSGRVERCKEGYFKSTADLSICLPHTRCPVGHRVKYSGTTTSDVVCEEINTERETISQKPTDIERNQTDVPDQPEEDNLTLTQKVILYVVGLVILVIIAMITLCWYASRYPEKLGCVNRLIKRFKDGCSLGISDSPTQEKEENVPSYTQGEATNNGPVYESIYENSSLLTEHAERSSQSEILPDVSLHVDPSNLSEALQPEDLSGPTSEVSPYAQADLTNCNDGGSIGRDTGTLVKMVSSEDTRDLDESHGDGRRPVGIVMPISIRIDLETQEESNPGHVTVPTQEGQPGQLVVTGQRVRDCPPISSMYGLSNGDQH